MPGIAAGHLCIFLAMRQKYFGSYADSLLNLTRKLVLASASPRRAALLQTLGIPFVQAPLTDAEPLPQPADQAHPATFVERLARHKAEHCPVPETLPRPLAVLAADTIVWHDGKILNKPRDAAEAVQMLRTLRGNCHQVFTGICLKVLSADSSSAPLLVEHEITHVYFAPVSDSWVDLYVAGGEPLDKAGAYAAQGRGAALVQRIEGDYWNVVGLPLARLARMLETIEAPLETWWEKDSAE